MVKKSAEIKGNVVSNLRGGEGDITMFGFMNEQEAMGSGRLFAKLVIEPGCSIGEHTHEGDMEAYYVIKGKGLLNDNGTEVMLEPGDCNICADGKSHSIKCVGDEALEFIAVILYTKQKEV